MANNSNFNDIKQRFTERLSEFTGCGWISKIVLEYAETCDELLSVITNLDSNKLRAVFKSQALTPEFMMGLFGEETLADNCIYCKNNGEYKLFGNKNIIVFGNTCVEVTNGMKVCAYGDSRIKLYKAAQLEAFDSVYFESYDKSFVKVDVSDVIPSGVTGQMFGESKGEFRNNNGCIFCDGASFIKAENCTGITLKGSSSAEFKHCAYISVECDSSCETEDTTLRCAGCSHVIAKKNSAIDVWGGGCRVEAYNNAVVNVYNGKSVIANNTANVYINTSDLNTCEAHDSSVIRISEMGVRLKAYDRVVVMDYTEKYTESFNNAIIIWMTNNKIFKNNRQCILD